MSIRPRTEIPRFGAGSTAVAALIGVGDIAADLVGTADAIPEFQRWNRRLYNPLCVTLACLVPVSSRLGS